MKARDIGALPVTDSEKIKGMLTDRDIVLRCVAEGRDPATTTAREAMTEEIKFVFDDEDVSRAAEAMSDRQIRRLVVLNRNKRLVGLVSMGDICRDTHDDKLSAGVAKCCAESVEMHAAHH
jgi:CBS domain-containing protein